MAARAELLQTLVRTWMAASMYNVHTCQVSKQGPKQNHSENICYFLQRIDFAAYSLQLPMF